MLPAGMREPDVTWRARLLTAIRGVHLDPADEERYQEERIARNRRGIRTAASVLLPVHVLVAILYWPAGGPFADPTTFESVVCLADLAMFPLVFGLVSLVWWVEPHR